MNKAPGTDGADTSLLTLEEVAQRLHVGRTFCAELVSSGRLPTVRIGRLVRVRPADLANYLDGLAVAPSAKQA